MSHMSIPQVILATASRVVFKRLPLTLPQQSLLGGLFCRSSVASSCTSDIERLLSSSISSLVVVNAGATVSDGCLKETIGLRSLLQAAINKGATVVPCYHYISCSAAMQTGRIGPFDRLLITTIIGRPIRRTESSPSPRVPEGDHDCHNQCMFWDALEEQFRLELRRLQDYQGSLLTAQ